MTGFRRVLNGLVPAAFVVVGVLQLVWCIWESADAVIATHWPTVLGIVQSAEVLEMKSGRGTGHVPRVTYAYEVDGVKYKGDRIYITDVGESPDQARNTIAPFPANASVRVYFDRDDPSRSLLKPGLYWYSAAWFGMAVMGIAVGLGLYYSFTTRRAYQ
jgi:hypothetical protein